MIEPQWSGPLDDAGAAELRALADAAEAVDGSPPFSDDVLLDLRGDGARHLLARDGGGTLVGAVHLGADGTAELVVHPGHRRAGLGARLAGDLLAAADDSLRVWAHGEHPGAVALAARFGLARTRTLWQLHRPLPDDLSGPDGLPPLEVADGVTIRPFVVGADEEEFLRVNNAAFDWHPEQGGWDLDKVRTREAEPWFDPAGFLLAVDAEDRLLGFHWTKVHAGTPPEGEVYVLGVDPSARGLRLGWSLTLAGLLHLHSSGLRRVLLYVEADNDAAVRLYTGIGFTLRHSDVQFGART